MEPKDPMFPPVDKESMTKQLQDESADYKASQPAERNEGWLHSGVNQVTYNSYNNPAFKVKADGNNLVPKDSI